MRGEYGCGPPAKSGKERNQMKRTIKTLWTVYRINKFLTACALVGGLECYGMAQFVADKHYAAPDDQPSIATPAELHHKASKMVRIAALCQMRAMVYESQARRAERVGAGLPYPHMRQYAVGQEAGDFAQKRIGTKQAKEGMPLRHNRELLQHVGLGHWYVEPVKPSLLRRVCHRAWRWLVDREVL